MADEMAVAARVIEMRNGPADGKSLQAARLKKTQLECERIEAAIRRESIGYITLESAGQMASAFFTVIRAMLNGIAGNLPGSLEGSTPSQIHEALKSAHYDMLVTLSTQALCENHPEMIKCRAEMERLDRKNLCHECRQPKDQPL